MKSSWPLFAAWVTLVAALVFLSAKVQGNAEKTRQVVCGTLVAQINVTLAANEAIITPDNQVRLANNLDDLWRESGCVGEVPPEWSQQG